MTICEYCDCSRCGCSIDGAGRQYASVYSAWDENEDRVITITDYRKKKDRSIYPRSNEVDEQNLKYMEEDQKTGNRHQPKNRHK